MVSVSFTVACFFAGVLTGMVIIIVQGQIILYYARRKIRVQGENPYDRR